MPALGCTQVRYGDVWTEKEGKERESLARGEAHHARAQGHRGADLVSLPPAAAVSWQRTDRRTAQATSARTNSAPLGVPHTWNIESLRCTAQSGVTTWRHASAVTNSPCDVAAHARSRTIHGRTHLFLVGLPVAHGGALRPPSCAPKGPSGGTVQAS